MHPDGAVMKIFTKQKPPWDRPHQHCPETGKSSSLLLAPLLSASPSAKGSDDVAAFVFKLSYALTCHSDDLEAFTHPKRFSEVLWAVINNPFEPRLGYYSVFGSGMGSDFCSSLLWSSIQLHLPEPWSFAQPNIGFGTPSFRNVYMLVCRNAAYEIGRQLDAQQQIGMNWYEICNQQKTNWRE